MAPPALMAVAAAACSNSARLSGRSSSISICCRVMDFGWSTMPNCQCGKLQHGTTASHRTELLPTCDCERRYQLASEAALPWGASVMWWSQMPFSVRLCWWATACISLIAFPFHEECEDNEVIRHDIIEVAFRFLQKWKKKHWQFCWSQSFWMDDQRKLSLTDWLRVVKGRLDDDMAAASSSKVASWPLAQSRPHATPASIVAAMTGGRKPKQCRRSRAHAVQQSSEPNKRTGYSYRLQRSPKQKKVQIFISAMNCERQAACKMNQPTNAARQLLHVLLEFCHFI